MILDLARFVAAERPYWSQLEALLDRMESDTHHPLTLEEAWRLHHLYQRTSADLARMQTFSGEGELRQYLDWLVLRAYAEIHESRGRFTMKPWRWVTHGFPVAFRHHLRAFQLCVLLTLAGMMFGAIAVRVDPEAKAALMPFSELQITPAERVAQERASRGQTIAGHEARFSAELMTHNTRVALTTLALGVTFGFGTVIILFYNGIVLGTVGMDFIGAQQTPFLLGWLLPHGVIEIPAILISGQAGLVIASAMMGWSTRVTRAERLRRIGNDVAMLALGAGLLLVWAGLVEGFISQYHDPVLPYSWKIAFGTMEALLLCLYLSRAGRPASPPGPREETQEVQRTVDS